MTTSNHLTPGEVADTLTGAGRGDGVPRMCWPHQVIEALAEHGYVIVHQDDVPTYSPDAGSAFDVAWSGGWNACRMLIVEIQDRSN